MMSFFLQSMNHSSNEVKQVMASSAVYLSRKSKKQLPLPLLKMLIPMLVNGTKEKNTMVRAHSEQALVSVLELRGGQSDTCSSVLSVLDAGGREALQDCIQKTLKKTASMNEPKEEEFDETLLT